MMMMILFLTIKKKKTTDLIPQTCHLKIVVIFGKN